MQFQHSKFKIYFQIIKKQYGNIMEKNIILKKVIKAHPSSGFSLVEIIIAISLLGAISLGVMQLTKSMNVSKVKYDFGSETSLITNEIVAILSNPTNCTASFAGKNAASTAVGINNIVQGGQNKYLVNQNYGNASIRINSYVLSDADADVDVATNTTKLLINFANKQIVNSTTPTAQKQIRLHVNVNSSGNITNCRSLSSSSTDIWTRGQNTDIYYNGGNVGIGSTTPASKLDINGEIKISSTGMVCNNTREGSIKYDSVSKTVKYCNGVLWLGMGGGLTYIGNYDLRASSTNIQAGKYLINTKVVIHPNVVNGDYSYSILLRKNGSEVDKFSFADTGDSDGIGTKTKTLSSISYVNENNAFTLSSFESEEVGSGFPNVISLDKFSVEVFKLD